MDRITSKATPEGTLSYTYDAAGHVASIASSNTNGASMNYTYDSLNRLSTVTDNRLTGSNTTTYTYDTASNVATVTYPNGVESTFTYDTLNRFSGLSSQPANYTYHRGSTGNLTSVTESSGRTVNWTYDGIYRLTNEAITSAPSGNNGSVGYGLDPVGNRQTESSSLSGVSSGTWTFNSDDELSSETYDQNGNVTATGGKTFSYNSQNQLVSMNSGAATIVYDAFGNRVSKTVNGVTTKYLVESDLNPTGYPQVFDKLTNGAVTRTYTYGLQRIDENQLVSNTWTPSFYNYDGGGNVRQLTSTAGTVTDSYEYDAFGNAFTVSGSTPNNYLYRGEQWDPDLELHYMRARFYNPQTGSFFSRDPEGGDYFKPSTLHRYVYAGDDPVDFADPSGRATATAVRSSATALDYALIVAEVSLGAVAAIKPIAEDVNCMLYTAAAALDAIAGPNLGLVQTLHISRAGCTAYSTAVWSNFPACAAGIGQCDNWVKKNRQPGELYIVYHTVNPVPACGRFGKNILSKPLNALVSNNGYHWGLLEGDTVRDSIFPGGIPLGLWEGAAYEVPSECVENAVQDTTSFEGARALGIGTITISLTPPPTL